MQRCSKKLFHFFMLLSLGGCSPKYPPNDIVIKGIVKNIPSRKVYLTDAYLWQKLEDSAAYNNDTFSFRITSDNFEPHLVTICFFDKIGKRHSLTIENPILSNNDAKYGETAFMVDKGVTIISGTISDHQTIKTDKLKIIGSKQNNPFFKTQLSDFGWINTENKKKRSIIINSYKKLIKQYPYSYYFIKLLYDYRTQYSKKELTEMLDLFNPDIQYHSSYSNKFSYYFNTMPTPGKPLKDYTLKDSAGIPHNILQPSSTLNMIIFWASWCAPCRREIPELKKIYAEFKNKGFSMVSVSVDDDLLQWKSALEKESMGWKQLIADSTLKEKVKSSFNFSVIPLVIFTDANGVEIDRISADEPDNYDRYKSIIQKNL